MFSQQELCVGMERNCYCCRPGPILPPASYHHPSSCVVMEPGSHGPPLTFLPAAPRHDPAPARMDMDVDSALSELDHLQSATGGARPKASPGGSVADQHGYDGAGGDRKGRARSLSESMAGSSRQLKHSHSESSLHSNRSPECGGGGGGGGGQQHTNYQQRKLCAMGLGGKGCSLSLPARKSKSKVCGYSLLHRNAAFVSDISDTRLRRVARGPLQHSSSLPARWVSVDGGGVGGGYAGDPCSERSPPPPPPLSQGMGVYRDSDLLEERTRQRRLARVRFERSRRLRQPYSIPLRMCQSMSDDRTASLNEFLKDASAAAAALHPQQQGQQRGSKSNTTSPVKQDCDARASSSPSSSSSSSFSSSSVAGGAALVRSRSIDNLELAKLRLTDVLGAPRPALPLLPPPPASSPAPESLELEQVASDLKNLQMV